MWSTTNLESDWQNDWSMKQLTTVGQVVSWSSSIQPTSRGTTRGPPHTVREKEIIVGHNS